MLIRKLILPGVGGIVGLLFACAMAADKPNFTGVWIRNAGARDAFTAVVIPLIGPKKNTPYSNFLLRINHRDKHLQVAVEQDTKRPVIADYDLGRGWHSSPGGRIQFEFGGTRYRSKWKRDILVIEKHAHFRGNFGTAGASVEQQWALSPSGDVLTITTNIDGFSTKEVFNRQRPSP